MYHEMPSFFPRITKIALVACVVDLANMGLPKAIINESEK